MSRLNIGTITTVTPSAGVVAVPSGTSAVSIDPGESGSVTVSSFTGLSKGDLLAVKNAQSGSTVTLSASATVYLNSASSLGINNVSEVVLFIAVADNVVSLVG